MFNRKKAKTKELRRIVEETRAELIKVNGQCAHFHHQADALRTERDELLTANGQLKHDLETESRQKEEISDLLTKEKKQSCKLRQQLEKAKAQAKDAAGLQVEIEKLTADTEALIVRIENQAKTIADLQKGGDVQALKDKVLVEVAADLGCPDSCVHHANPGPGASICRNCIRNPRAVDKYTTETI